MATGVLTGWRLTIKGMNLLLRLEEIKVAAAATVARAIGEGHHLHALIFRVRVWLHPGRARYVVRALPSPMDEAYFLGVTERFIKGCLCRIEDLSRVDLRTNLYLHWDSLHNEVGDVSEA
jgi:hypothetical protein